jgi:hypothetical protein
MRVGFGDCVFDSAAAQPRSLEDVFAIQTEVAERIVAALEAKLSGPERDRLDNGRPGTWPPSESWGSDFRCAGSTTARQPRERLSRSTRS